MSRDKRDATVELACNDDYCDTTWMVEGRITAGAEFEPYDVEELDCPECGERGEPTDEDVRMADV